MRYYIFALQFEGPFRFSPQRGIKSLDNTGNTLPSDALFSALTVEGIALYGKGFAEKMAEKARADRLLISNLLPCCWIDKQMELFIPRPHLSVPRSSFHLTEQSLESDEKALTNRKKLKKLQFIPLTRLDSYIAYMQEPTPERLGILLEPSFQTITTTEWKNRVLEQGEETLPYPVVVNRINDTTNYYFVIAMDDDWRDEIETVVESLGYTGLGGKRSIGYGKFTLAEDPFELDLENPQCNDYLSYKRLAEALVLNQPDYFMTLSAVLPKEGEFQKIKEKSFYSLSARTGFVASEDYAMQPLKKKSVIMLDAGSCFPQTFASCITDVGNQEGSHPVYRMGKALFMGVRMDG